jgi:photosystem II stability/assembly factor-like uncharacterized protein
VAKRTAKRNGKIHVFIGTRRGIYVAESDRSRRKWKVQGPTQPTGEVFHAVADPRHEGRAYAAVNSWFFGPMLFRSDDWGRRWTEIPAPLLPVHTARPPKFDPETFQPNPEAKSPIVNLWHIEPGPESEPDSVFVGVDPASLYRSDDSGQSWEPMNGLNEHETRSKWNPGAGGMCPHTILIDPQNPKRMYVGISAAGTFRSDNGGETWRPLNKGIVVDFLPEKRPEVGQCVHKVAMDPANPRTLYRQDHSGIYVSRDAAETWIRVGRPLPYDFGFVTASPKARPGTAYFVPLEGMSRLTLNGGLQVDRWQEKGRSWQPTVRGRPFAGEVGTHREGMAADDKDPPGLYLGTTTGQLFVSPDGARTWNLVPYLFPGIHSVTAASPPDGR